MVKIEYPQYPFKLKEENGKEWIFDEIRKLWVRITPEEWVRQNFIRYLVQIKNYPPVLMAIEKEISLGELKKRCDIVVYKNDKPWMIVECKETGVILNHAVAEQVFRYNISLKVRYLVVTNGSYTFAMDTRTGTAITALPLFDELQS